MRRKLLLNLLLLLFAYPVFATTFIVTSNADAGAGTLRDAVQQATNNGTSVMDTILFNLPLDFNSRTIYLQSTINIPSNIVIDGTSQPGNKWGVSDAKICIALNIHNTIGYYVGFNLYNISNCEIYGLWFKDFYHDKLPTDPNGYTYSTDNFALVLFVVNNFTLGKAGKGNVFSNDNYSIYDTNDIFAILPGRNSSKYDTVPNVNVKIVANLFGLDTSGNSNDLTTNINFTLTRNLTVGGPDKSDGNYFAKFSFDVGDQLRETTNPYSFIDVENNSFGYNYNHTKILGASSLKITGGNVFGYGNGKNVKISQVDDGYYSIKIRQNNFGEINQNTHNGNVIYPCIYITDIGNDIDISNNILSTGYGLGLYDGIYITGCKKKDSLIIKRNRIVNFKTGIFVAGNGVTISNNEISCNQKGIFAYSSDPRPSISIKTITPTSVSGKTCALCKVEVFITDTCEQYCENGKKLLGTTMSDASGLFTLNCNTANGNISATSTNSYGSTSEFNGVKVDTLFATIKDCTCSHGNGSITGIKILNASSWYWEDSLGKQISTTDTNLVNLSPGKYRLVLSESNVNCNVITGYYTVNYVPAPAITGLPFAVYNPTCGQANGSLKFTGILPQNTVYEWEDSVSNVLPSYYYDSIAKLFPQKIYFKVALYQDSTCNTLLGPITLTNQLGASLNLNNLKVTDASCNKANGDITNITAQGATGTQFVQWQDSLGNSIAKTWDLTNVKAGKYRLQFKDGGGCDTVNTGYYTIKNLGRIGIDYTKMVVKAASCKGADGYIKGIVATNADTLKWITTANKKVGDSVSLFNQSPGLYKLLLSNSYGCQNETNPINIGQSVYAGIDGIGVAMTNNAFCGKANGGVDSLLFGVPISSYSFVWTNSKDSIILSLPPSSSKPYLKNVGAGTYFLTAIDSNGCKQTIFNTVVKQFGVPYFDYSHVIVKNDTCTLKTGSITNLQANGGAGSYIWQWKQGTKIIASTPNTITNLPAGTFDVIINDQFGCADTSKKFIIKDINIPLPIPDADSISIFRGTKGTFIVMNPQAGMYYLYDTVNAIVPIDSSISGRLTTPNVMYDKEFFIKHVVGSCNSGLYPVIAHVFDATNVFIPSAFSPNGDTHNDIFKPLITTPVADYYLQIYNRYGQMIFETKNADVGWDGTFNGIYQNTSTFVYKIYVKDILGNVFRKNGTLVLLR